MGILDILVAAGILFFGQTCRNLSRAAAQKKDTVFLFLQAAMQAIRRAAARRERATFI